MFQHLLLMKRDETELPRHISARKSALGSTAASKTDEASRKASREQAIRGFEAPHRHPSQLRSWHTALRTTAVVSDHRLTDPPALGHIGVQGRRAPNSS